MQISLCLGSDNNYEFSTYQKFTYPKEHSEPDPNINTPKID